jgi:hypothetical protein
MNRLSFSDQISIASTLIAFFGFLLVIWQISITNEQIRKAEITQRAQLLAALQERATGSKDFQEVFRKIEYGDLKYNNDFHGSRDQTQLIALLSFFEFIAQLEKMGLIQFEDVEEVFGYYMLRTHTSRGLQEYLDFLKRWIEGGEYPENIAFPNFESLAKRLAQANASAN